MRLRAETSREILGWFVPAPHAYEIFPNIAGRFAPVAEGTLDGLRFHVAYAMSANAVASFASDGNPNSSEKRIFRPRGPSSLASMASSVGLLTPPPETTKSPKLLRRRNTKRRNASAMVRLKA